MSDNVSYVQFSSARSSLFRRVGSPACLPSWLAALEDHGFPMAEDHAPGVPRRLQAGRQGGAGFDADQVNLAELLLPAGASVLDREMFLHPVAPLDLVAVIDPVEDRWPAVPGQVAAPVVGVEDHRPPAVVLVPLSDHLEEAIQRLLGNDRAFGVIGLPFR